MPGQIGQSFYLMLKSKGVLTSILFILVSLPVWAQTYTVSGIVKDDVNEPLIGASVTILGPEDTYIGGNAADLDGNFIVHEVPEGTYTLRISYIGYEDYRKQITVPSHALNVGIIKMAAVSTTQLTEVNIVEKAQAVIQKDDTTQFNANAFKVNADATAEDLIRKMPGMDLSGSKPQTQGEQITKVLVDGKPFFGDDVTSSLKNLPAEVIDKIQVYDERSEQAQFTGFDDGNTTKTINIITRSDKSQGVFGRLYGGYGYEDKYSAGGNVNYFEGDRRVSLIGMSNNINQQNFASDDLLGVSSGGSRGGRGGRRGGRNAFENDQQGGIATTNAIGLNYSDKWGEKIEVTGSYFFNNSQSESEEFTQRNFVIPSQEGQSYMDTSVGSSTNTNHRLNLRLNYQIDSNNSILFIPRLSFQNSSSNSSLHGLTLQSGTDVLNRTLNDFLSDRNGYNLSSMFLYRHKFAKPGRTFSLWANGGLNKNDGSSKLYAISDLENEVDTLDQWASRNNNGWDLNTSLNYTEPLSRKSFLQVQYRIRYQESASDKRTYNYDQTAGDYILPDTLLSNQYTTDYLTHRAGLGYRYMDSSFNFNMGLDYQYATLNSDRVLPYVNRIQVPFNNLLPYARLQYKFSRRQSLRFSYRTSTDAPSVDQLQDVIDNSNPLQLSTGNPNLVQAYEHRMNVHYNSSNPKNNSTFFAMLSGNLTQDYIGNNTIIAEDSMTVDGVQIPRGGQLSRPENLSGYMNLRAFTTYGRPVNFLRSNLNLNVGAGFVRTPGLINDQKNLANNTNFSLGLVLSSNISEKIDFTLSSNSSINFVKNTLNTNADNQYFNQSSRLALNYVFWRGIVINSEINHQLYTGLSEGFNQNFFLWNMSVGKKLFRKQQGEIKLSVFDLLGQNTSIARTITETYAQDVISNVLQRYFMLTFTYNLRFFKGGASMKDVERSGPGEGPHPGGPGGPFEGF